MNMYALTYFLGFIEQGFLYSNDASVFNNGRVEGGNCAERTEMKLNRDQEWVRFLRSKDIWVFDRQLNSKTESKFINPDQCQL
jgi:hypothetical protein